MPVGNERSARGVAAMGNATTNGLGNCILRAGRHARNLERDARVVGGAKMPCAAPLNRFPRVAASGRFC